MKTFFERQLPEACEDELAAAFQFVNEVAYKFGLDPIDIQTIARSASYEEAESYIDKLKRVEFDLRIHETDIIIDHSVRAYNNTSVLVSFGEAVGVAMRDWEEKRRLPLMSIWCSHPSNFDSLRTFVWAQEQFRTRVEVAAHRKLTKTSSLGTHHDALGESKDFTSEPTPVVKLIDWIKLEYRDVLGIYPIPG